MKLSSSLTFDGIREWAVLLVGLVMISFMTTICFRHLSQDDLSFTPANCLQEEIADGRCESFTLSDGCYPLKWHLEKLFE
jgi:hypothetical protein